MGRKDKRRQGRGGNSSDTPSRVREKSSVNDGQNAGPSTRDPILAEIERLKQDYARSGSRDPNMLSAIHALERDYASRQSGGQQGQHMPMNQNPYAPWQNPQPIWGAPMMNGMGAAYNPMLMQQQMQQQMMHQQQQMALERQRMEREMEEMMRERDEDRFGAQRMQMQQMMAGLTPAIAGTNSSAGQGTALQNQLAMMAGASGNGGQPHRMGHKS